MYIFYDFETSSKEFLGQIMSYAFIVTKKNFEIKRELTGKIKLNRTQLPEVDAILTNRINVVEHQKVAEAESMAAQRIFDFLSQEIENQGAIYLVGFNSNSFDLAFLRNLLIRYGINPYFKGRLVNIDLLNYTKYLAFQNQETFKWTLFENKDKIKYYSFKLEHTAKSYGVLTEDQTHDARDDVIVTINLAKKLEHEFKAPLDKFKPVQILSSTFSQDYFEIAKQKVIDFPESCDQVSQKFKYKYWAKVISSKKELIILDLEKYAAEKEILGCLSYINPNKHFLILEPATVQEKDFFQPVLEKLSQDQFVKNLTSEKYFELIKKDWDIEYQIHELGFKRIDRLKSAIDALSKNYDSYDKILKELLKERKEQKDNFLIQLFNRYYLNYHPKAKIEHLHKYLMPRYFTAELVRDKASFNNIFQALDKMDSLINDPATSKSDKTLLESLKLYYFDFIKINQLT
ncbi:MAG: hypothetical protein WC860_04895 [Candidatus Margulisiibacteriota bacterium]|jgi:hypothetical protein